MYSLIKKQLLKSDIQTEKKLKMARTEAYLRVHRKVYQPQVPIGFKTRNSSSYYLTTHHKLP